MLPNLIVIGAAKAGTTSLHAYLALHPEVEMSRHKELQFFVRRRWREQVDWYADQFPAARIRGESSPTYTMYPWLPSTADRIHELVPDTRLIYVLRDPVERAIASYVEHVYLGVEDRPIRQALLEFDRPDNPYLCASRYATQSQRFLDHFSRSEILVIDQTDLLRNRLQCMAQVFRFLDVDPAFHSAQFGRLHNTSDVKVRYNRLGFWMVRRGLFTRQAGHLSRGPLVAPLRKLMSRPIDRRLPPEDRDRLVAALRPEVEQLRDLTGQSWSQWPSFPA